MICCIHIYILNKVMFSKVRNRIRIRNKDRRKQRQNIIDIKTLALTKNVLAGPLWQATELFTYETTGSMCVLTPLETTICTNDIITKQFESIFPSYNYTAATKTILVNDTDFINFCQNPAPIVQDLSQSLQTTELETYNAMATHFRERKILIRPTGLSGFVHRLTNSFVVTGSAINTFYVTAASHISGVTGPALLQATPILYITFPTVGGIFFASAERLLNGTCLEFVGTGCGIARDFCLVPIRIIEIGYNEIVAKPLLANCFDIHAPLNISSYLRVGTGVQAVNYTKLKPAIKTGVHYVIDLIKNKF